jgi:hypothetical protein
MTTFAGAALDDGDDDDDGDDGDDAHAVLSPMALANKPTETQTRQRMPLA